MVVVDAQTLRPTGRIETALGVQSLATSPDGRLVAAGLVRHRSVIIAELTSGGIRHEIQLLPEADGRVNVVDFSPDGSRIAAGDIDGLLYVIDVGSGQRLGEPARLHTGVVLDARWLDDATVATTGSDGRVVLYDVRRGLVRGQPIPFTRDGGEDGGYLVTASRDELVVMGAIDLRTQLPPLGVELDGTCMPHRRPQPHRRRMGVLRPFSAVPRNLRLALLREGSPRFGAADLRRDRAAGECLVDVARSATADE